MHEPLAVIATGGKQYLVRPEDIVRIEKIGGNEGESVTFSEVLLVVGGEQVSVGQPTVAGAIVKASIVKHGRAKKVVGVKFKPKKRQKKTFGHRQHYTAVKIEQINTTA